MRAAALVLSLLAACGSQSTRVSVSVGPTGDEVCLPDRRVCVSVPPGALTEVATVALGPLNNQPGGAFGEGAVFTVDGKSDYAFAKAVEVRFALSALPLDRVPSENLLKVYAKGTADSDWAALDDSVVDRVRDAVIGHASKAVPVIVLRTDRLSDGGLPVEGTMIMRDAGVIVIPPVPDAGRRDAGVPDAGRPDAGVADAGPMDSGVADAGRADSGVLDAGAPDAGPSDAGTPDAGAPDAGRPDAGPPDAGPIDSGVPDAGPADAGAPDAGTPDSGTDAGLSDAGSGDGG